MLPLAILALQAPAQFAIAVDKYVAGDTLRVADWWEDDLDDDGANESIALLCDDRHGVYLVQTAAGVLLEAPVEIDGRNSCHATVGRPAWHVEHDGAIVERVEVHHGEDTYALAIRDRKLVVVRQRSTGFDVTREGRTSETDTYDYDHLTFSHHDDDDSGAGTTTHGAWVLLGDGARVTRLTGATVTARRSDGRTTIHVHADHPVSLRSCNDQATPCTVAKASTGDFDVAFTTDKLFLVIDGDAIELNLGDEGGYPAPPKPW